MKAAKLAALSRAAEYSCDMLRGVRWASCCCDSHVHTLRVIQILAFLRFSVLMMCDACAELRASLRMRSEIYLKI